MMLYPPMADLVEKIGSRYLLVNVVANRARKISAEAEAMGEPMDRKSVSAAIDEVYTGKLSLRACAADEFQEFPEEAPTWQEAHDGASAEAEQF